LSGFRISFWKVTFSDQLRKERRLAMTEQEAPNKGNTALITGASSGIGYELAREFARHGHDLVLVARNRQKLEALAADLEGAFDISASVLVKDLALPDSADEIYEELRRDSVAIDILVNNAGMIVYGNFHKTDWEQEMRMIQLNLVTLSELTKRFVGGMVARGGGKILNVGSNGSFAPSPLNAVYSATKAYVLSFFEAIAEELDSTGVTVTAFLPGATRTELQKRGQMDDVRLMRVGVMDPVTVAEQAYSALMAGKRVALPGLLTQLQFFAVRFLPRVAVVKMSKAMLQRTP
jgi:short-subunit dehydrogenase